MSSYNSVVSFIDFYYGDNLRDEFKNKYSNLEDCRFYNLIIDVDYSDNSMNRCVTTKIDVI